MNRDRKKHKEPFKLKDFYMYGDPADYDSIEPIYGATAMQLVKEKRYPGWALFAYKDLIKNAENGKPADILWIHHDDCVILCPKFTKNSNRVRGLLIANAPATGKELILVDDTGNKYKISIPVFDDFVLLRENIALDCVKVDI